MKTKVAKCVYSVAILIVVAALLVFGCGQDSTTELPTANVVQPPTSNISGSWKGTYNYNPESECDSSKTLPAKAAFQQNGSSVTGMLIANGSCGLNYPFQGTLEGNRLNGVITGSLNPAGTASGEVSGSTLVISASNGNGYVMGTMHLHR